MHVGQLLDLECSFEAGGEVVATSHDEERLLIVQLLGNFQNVIVLFQNLLDLKGNGNTDQTSRPR